MPTTVAKFGGSSLADADRVRRVVDIIKRDPDRCCIVISAPGRRNPDDRKVTDLLLAAAANKGDERKKALSLARDRFIAIVRGLSLKGDLEDYLFAEFQKLERQMNGAAPPSRDYVASRGEFFMARILATALNWKFVDATRFIRLTPEGRYDRRATEEAFANYRLPKQSVLPGYYGLGPGGELLTFSRNGSDISGAIVSVLVKADKYENWTDTDGILAADPAVVSRPRSITMLTRAELLELAYGGANVLHGESLAPLAGTDIPVVVKNTFTPTLMGTYVVADKTKLRRKEESVVGIAGKGGFSVLTVTKLGMAHERGFLVRLLSAFVDLGVSITTVPSAVESQSVIFEDEELNGNEELLLSAIRARCEPDTVELERRSLGLLCVVGETMAHHHGVAAGVFGALRSVGINIRTIDQGATERSIVIGVVASDLNNAQRAVYRQFFKTS